MWGHIFNLNDPLIGADNTWVLWAICALGAATAIYMDDITHTYLNHEHDIFREYHYERLKEGQIEGGIFVVWNDPPFDADPLKKTHQMMAAITQEEPECADILKISRSYEDMIKAREAGKMYAFIGLEGLKSIGEDIDMIDEFYKFGARHASLAWERRKICWQQELAELRKED